MSVGENEIERIVREVLARLAPVSPSDASRSVSTASPVLNPGALSLSNRLVTVSELDGRLEGVRTVIVPPRAVITPAARDLLRQRGVTVASARLSWEKGMGATAGTVKSIVLGKAATSYEPLALIRALKQDGCEVEQVARTGLTGVIDDLADLAARGGKRCLLLTDESAAAACLANRLRGVRAATAADAAGVTRAGKSIGVNLLIVEPARRSLFQLRGIAREFLRSQAECPPEYANRLM
jgi:hypothetical protein